MNDLKPLDAQTAISKLCDHFLGEDYYIVDSVNVMQANAIIVDEIISRYKGASESPVDQWRRRHKKCIFCKYYEYPRCTAKMKRVYGDIPRLFCRVFQPKPFKED